MRRIIFILIFIFVCGSCVYAENLYIVVTTATCPDTHIGIFDGFGRLQVAECNITKGVSRHYMFGTTERGYMIEFHHVNFKKNSTDLEVFTLPISALNNLETVIEAEELMQFETADMAYNWMINHLENKTKLYIIDRREFYKSDPDLAAPNMMKVVEVEIWYEDIPDHIKGSVPILK